MLQWLEDKRAVFSGKPRRFGVDKDMDVDVDVDASDPVKDLKYFGREGGGEVSRPKYKIHDDLTRCVCVCVCVFIKLHITTQSGPVILVILCHSH